MKSAREESWPPQVPRWIPPLVYAFALAATIALLILHTIGIATLKIDTVTLGLLAILLLIPLAPNIRRLSAGGVAAEIGTGEARELQAKASQLPAAAPEGEDADLAAVKALIGRDPPLGLAQLRIELEKELRRLYAAHFPEKSWRGRSLGVMAGDLKQKGILPTDIADPLANVVALANRAVHGEYVAADIAAEIGAVGGRVLAALRETD